MIEMYEASKHGYTTLRGKMLFLFVENGGKCIPSIFLFISINGKMSYLDVQAPSLGFIPRFSLCLIPRIQSTPRISLLCFMFHPQWDKEPPSLYQVVAKVSSLVFLNQGSLVLNPHSSGQQE